MNAKNMRTLLLLTSLVFTAACGGGDGDAPTLTPVQPATPGTLRMGFSRSANSTLPLDVDSAIIAVVNEATNIRAVRLARIPAPGEVTSLEIPLAAAANYSINIIAFSISVDGNRIRLVRGLGRTTNVAVTDGNITTATVAMRPFAPRVIVPDSARSGREFLVRVVLGRDYGTIFGPSPAGNGSAGRPFVTLRNSASPLDRATVTWAGQDDDTSTVWRVVPPAVSADTALQVIVSERPNFQLWPGLSDLPFLNAPNPLSGRESVRVRLASVSTGIRIDF